MRKIHLLILLMLVTFKANSQIYLDPNADMEERIEDALSRMTTHEKIQVIHAQSKFTSAGVPRLGIRQLNMDDGPHGVREELEWNTWNPAHWTNDYVVAFPSLTCLASTWNRSLAHEYGKSIGEEFAFRGKDIMLGPGVNIARTPLNGRAFEYMGEDPCLAGEMVVPYIQGAQSNGVACCIKHFALNDQETDRFRVNVNVSERALREIYLYPFWKAVEKGKVYTIMGSYNQWKNIHCCHNDELLNQILKKEWGFDGAVVSDWGGTTDTRQAATGGLDIEMGTNTKSYDDNYLARPYEQLIENGEIPMSTLDDKVRRVLRTMFRTCMNPNKVIGKQCSEDHYATCRNIAEEGIVLLKNSKVGKSKQPILPINPDISGKILIVGENATRSLTKGGGSSELKTLYDVSPLEGLKKIFGEKVDFAQGYYSGNAIYNRVDKIDQAKQDSLFADAISKASNSDMVIFIGGMNKNHRQDCEDGDREGYNLSFGQDKLIERLAEIQPNLIVANFGGNPYAMPWIDKVAAVLQCWYLGSESGSALANILSGKVSPSGKLPVTFASQYEDYPYVKYGVEAYPGKDKQVYYKEDIYVGYRHFTTNKVKPLFPFGFGLSYTTFKYGKPTIIGNKLTVDVTNTGKMVAKETIQLYVGAENCSEDRPSKELKDFQKVELNPGETKAITFTLNDDIFRFWSVNDKGWKVEKGKYRIYAASSSDDDNFVTYTLQ